MLPLAWWLRTHVRCFSKHPTVFTVLVNGFIAIRENQTMNSEEGIPRLYSARGWRLIPVWGWGTGNTVEVSGPRRQHGFFYMELNLFKDLNCQRGSPVWHFEKRSKTRLCPSEKRFGCVYAPQPLAAHNWATKQDRDREKVATLSFVLNCTLIAPYWITSSPWHT